VGRVLSTVVEALQKAKIDFEYIGKNELDLYCHKMVEECRNGYPFLLESFLALRNEFKKAQYPNMIESKNDDKQRDTNLYLKFDNLYYNNLSAINDVDDTVYDVIKVPFNANIDEIKRGICTYISKTSSNNFIKSSYADVLEFLRLCDELRLLYCESKEKYDNTLNTYQLLRVFNNSKSFYVHESMDIICKMDLDNATIGECLKATAEVSSKLDDLLNKINNCIDKNKTIIRKITRYNKIKRLK
jgi:hypothetical protein